MDRARHHRPDSKLAQGVGARVRHAAPHVLVDLGGAAGPPYHRRGSVVGDFHARPGRPLDGILLPATADAHDRLSVSLEAAMPALSASSSRRNSSATAENISAGSIPRATSVATRRSAACSASRRASSSRLVSSEPRFCAFATAVATRSVNCRHPLLGVGRQRPLPGPYGDRSPQPAVDVYRHGDRGPQPLAEIRLSAREVTVIIDPGGLAGTPDGRGQPGRRVALPASLRPAHAVPSCPRWRRASPLRRARTGSSWR